jgi:hypothetical protein
VWEQVYKVVDQINEYIQCTTELTDDKIPHVYNVKLDKAETYRKYERLELYDHDLESDTIC